MELIIPLVIGGLLGYFTALYFSKQTSRENKELKELIVTQSIGISELTKKVIMLASKISIEDKGITGILNETQEDIQKVINKTKDVNAHTGNNFTLPSSEPTMNCPTCSKSMLPSGYKMTPSGYILHYRCPEHGEFMGMSFDDIYDE
jgi:gas vesicle protein